MENYADRSRLLSPDVNIKNYARDQFADTEGAYNGDWHGTNSFYGERLLEEQIADSMSNKEYLEKSEEEKGTVPSSGDVIPVRIYSRRWYILCLFALLSFTQCAIWYSWGPISDASKFAFGWSNGTMALLWNWGQICFIISSLVVPWIIETRGLRGACIFSCFFVVIGAGVKCITTDPDIATWLIQIGQILNGLGGAVTGAAPLLSSSWFPPNQRTTATAFSTVLNSLGVGVSFLIGPYVVPALPDITPSKINDTNSSCSHYVSQSDFTNSPRYNNNSDSEMKRHQIMTLMYVQFAWCAALFVLFLIYFPSAPPTPPSITASKPRESLKRGYVELCKNKNFWLVCFIYSVALGVYSAWQGILDVALDPLGFSQNEAGWIGFYSIVGSCVGTIILARFADVFSRHTKILLMILFSTASVFLSLFVFQCEQIIPNSKPFLYLSILTGGLLLNAASPLLYEISCEITYPVSEGLANIFLGTMGCVVGLVFVVLLLIPDLGTNWLNWCMMGSIPVCIPVMFVMKASYRRLNIDENSSTN